MRPGLDDESVAALDETVAVAVVGGDERLVPRVASILARDGLIAHVEPAGCGRLEIERLQQRPDVVLLADGGAQTTDVREVHRIRRRLPGAHIVLVLREDLVRDVRHVLDAGVDGVVLERTLDDTLASAVRSVRLGQVSVPRPMRHAIDVPALTHRERQVLSLVVAGLTNDEIAARLFLTRSTVKRHLTSAFRQLGVRSRREAAVLILTGDESLRRSVLTAQPPSSDDDESQGR